MLWAKAEPRHYARVITAQGLVCALIYAFVARWSGLREIALRMGRRLGTCNFSSLSPALSRTSTLAYVKALVEWLEPAHSPCRGELVALDSMAVTLPITQRHRCAKYNRSTAGGGVLWAFQIAAAAGSCPVKILHTMAGAWNDATLMKHVRLLAHGPVYLMDRGFYALKLIHNWCEQGVRFIVRARYNSIYEIVAEVGQPRPYGKRGCIELDAVVWLGCPAIGVHPLARMVRARIGREYIVLVTNQHAWSAEHILAAYRKRERIERFHRFVKDTLGLGHLYNFSQTGLLILIYTAVLIALLLFLSGEEQPADATEEETIVILRKAFLQVRAALGLGYPWRRNTNLIKRSPLARKYKWQQRQNL